MGAAFIAFQYLSVLSPIMCEVFSLTSTRTQETLIFGAVVVIRNDVIIAIVVYISIIVVSIVIIVVHSVVHHNEWKY